MKTDANPIIKQYVFIVGRAPGSADLLHQIRSLGYEVGLLADLNYPPKKPERYDLVVPFDFSDIQAALYALSVDGNRIAGFYCDYENYILPMARIAEALDVPAINPAAAMNCTDKIYMREAFKRFSPELSPAYAHVSSLEAALEFADRYSYPLIVKPTNLVKSLLIKKCATEQELREHVTYVFETIAGVYEQYHIYGRQPNVLIEQFIDGEQFSVAAYVDRSGTPHFCPGIVALRSAKDIGVDDMYLYSRTLPTDLPERTVEAMLSTSRQAVAALGLASSPAHIELMLTHDGEVKVIEIGARTGGYRPLMYAAAYDQNLYEQEIRMATGKPIDLRTSQKAYTAVYELFPSSQGTFVRIDGPELSGTNATMTVTAKPGKVVGQARDGFRAAAFVHVVATDTTTFAAACALVEQQAVVIAS